MVAHMARLPSFSAKRPPSSTIEWTLYPPITLPSAEAAFFSAGGLAVLAAAGLAPACGSCARPATAPATQRRAPRVRVYNREILAPAGDPPRLSERFV